MVLVVDYIELDLHEYPGGRRFTFADPWDNVLGVYEPADQGVRLMGEASALSAHLGW